MPSAAAARRASYRSSGAQQDRPDRTACSSLEYNRSEIPSTASLPRRSATSAAATEESTPPERAATVSMDLQSTARRLGSAALGAWLREQGERRDVLLGRLVLGRDPERHLGSGEVVGPFRLRLGRTLQPDVPAVRLHDLLGDGEAEARPRGALLAHPVGVEERLEDTLRLAGQEALALVVDLEEQPRRVARAAHQDVAAVRAELDRVVDQVGERLAQLAHVSEPVVLGLHPHLEVDAAALRLAALLLEDRSDQAAHLEVLAVDGLASAFQGGEVDQVVDGARKPLRRRGDRLHDPLLLVAQRAGLPSPQDLQVADDRGQRRR